MALQRSPARRDTELPALDPLWRLFPGDTETARRMRAFDWTRNALGPPATWPRSLRACVRVTLASRRPRFVWWGERLVNLYDDGYAAFLCGKHPAALGRPAPQVWPEIWEQLGPRVEQALCVDLPRRAGQTLALALHELGTNALEYGALRGPTGRLSARWAVRAVEGVPARLVLTWTERGVRGRARAGSPRRGFGRELVERALPFDLDAETELRIGDAGVRCRIELPLDPARREGAS